MIKRNFPSFSNRNYLIFWIGQTLSLIGSFMQATVQPYLAYRLTDEPIYLGYVGFAATLPGLLFIIPGGVIVERSNKKTIIILMQILMLIQALTLFYLTITHQITIWHIITLAFLIGIANSLEITARQSYYIDLVGKDLLPNAIALNSTAFNAARIVGPSLAAPFLIMTTDGEAYAFLANAISYLFVLISLFAIDSGTIKPNYNHERFKVSDLVVGPKYILHNPVILSMISMMAVAGLFGFPIMQFIPVIARDLLKGSGDSANIIAARNSILIAVMGIGAVVAAVYLSLNRSTKHNARLLKIGQLIFVAALISLSFTKFLVTAVPIMMAYGVGFVSQMTITNLTIQLAVPDSIRGRVLSAYIWVNQSSAPIGSLILGLMIQSLGISAALLTAGIICAVGFLVVRYMNPSVESLEIVQPR